MGKIALLSETLINQIAAGEVVERPASVLKELAENSLDAGARTLRIDLVDGGLTRIAVIDDGEGMTPEDAVLALQRHATSKLRDLEGLAHIDTLGFRGEALPSIASVSRFTLTTRTPANLAATRLRLEGGSAMEQSEVGAPAGTTVSVEDLFFNTPARKKFAKRPETEWAHCSEVVLRLALARPEVGFSVSHNGRASFSAPANQEQRERIAAAISPELFKHLIPVLRREPGLVVRGYATSPEFSLATNRGMHVFVNRRFIRDRALFHAIGRAYQSVLAAGRLPAAVLYLELPPDAVDVNAHPQKLEVRFSDARRVADAVVDAIRTALRDSPWMRGTKGLPPLEPETFGPRSVALPRPGVPIPGPSWAPVDPSESLGGWAETIVPFARTTDPGAESSTRAGEVVREPGETDSRTALRLDADQRGYFSSLRYIGQLAKTYLVCEAPGGAMVLIDQHAAYERVRLDSLRKQHAGRQLQGQPFLFPVQVTLSLADLQILTARAAAVAELGLELEPFGGETLALKSVPALLVGADYPRLLSNLARVLAQAGPGHPLEEVVNDALATLACHSATRNRQALGADEVRLLLGELDGVDFTYRCPHGRPLAAEVPLAEIERRAERR